ncbi:lmo0937 family membrane protein [Flavitalea sp. BT771]|nr:lmo0937 family membrane protein [Flavitalea sp. BT771]MDO6431772.1 lmo0937 family membrane protein [Flavitalea sp. BT771]
MYVIAVVLTIGWVVGVFVFHLGNAVHVLILLAITALLGNIMRDGTWKISCKYAGHSRFSEA